MQIRVQKFLSEQGVASRRKAEEFIKSGQVLINGTKAKLGDKVDPEKDEIKVYGKIIKPESSKVYIALYKPFGYVSTKSDPRGRRTIYSLLPAELRTKLWSVGRLDFETEGLIIMTNDGELTQELSHPKYEHDKEYEVTPDREIKDSQIKILKNGVKIKSGVTAPAKVRRKNNLIFISVHEGKKRQVRQMFNRVGLGVKNLKRVRVNNYTLPSKLKPGEYVHIKKSDIL